MTCERIAHPYMDESGTSKHVGEVGISEAECASVVVSSNRIVEIDVSAPDDFDRQDGTTEFCRSYDEVCPLSEVVFTAPPTSGAGTGFRRWSKDGVVQPEDELSVSLNPCDGICHTLRAVYGGTGEFLFSCGDTSHGITIPLAAKIVTSANYTPLPCDGGPGCPNDTAPYQPSQCYNTLWQAWNNGEFEVDYRADLPFPWPYGEVSQVWTTHTDNPFGGVPNSVHICSPAVFRDDAACVPTEDPVEDPCWCECDVGANCISPIIECTTPKWCTGFCQDPFPDMWGYKFWTRQWHGHFNVLCICTANEVRLYWYCLVFKKFCARVNFGDCCFPTPFGCGCSAGPPLQSGLNLAFDTGDVTNPLTWPFISEQKSPGESCGEPLQRIWDKLMAGEVTMQWERDDIVRALPFEATPCLMRRQESIEIVFG